MLKKLVGIIPVTCLCLIYLIGFVEWSDFSIYNTVKALVLYAGSVLVSLHVRRNDLSKGALIMGLGIIALGPLHTLHLVNDISIAPFLLGGLWLQISVHYIAGSKNVLKYSDNDPNETFLIGAWVAATSVVGVNILYYYPDVVWISRAVASIAFVIWVYYIVLVVRQFISFKRSSSSIGHLHGGILLTTVSTQSVVIVCDWSWSLPIVIESIFLYIGILFYIVSASLLAVRYAKYRWNVTDDWKNTNCIIHGAVSITGVAWFNLTGEITKWFIGYWWFGLLLFILIESIEMYRAIRRVAVYGVQSGLWVYHPSQWARIFTFGMFYYLTFSIINTSTVDLTLEKTILSILGPAILLITFLQLSVMLTQSFTLRRTGVNETL